jgi:hypothetical protein
MSRVKEEMAPGDYEIDPQAISRFEDKFIPEPNSGCWLWTAAISGKGYGRFGLGGKSRIASRVSYRIYKGDVPSRMFVCHTCDNPSCVNPDHLWLGSLTDNVRDCAQKGRLQNQRITHCAHGHPYDAENTYRQTKGRGCRTCRRVYVRRHKAKIKAASRLGDTQ